MPDEMNKREVILTIREYENSVAMPEGERVTYLDPRGGVHLKDGDDKASDYTGHAAKCAEYLRFGDEVDAVTCGEYPRSSAVKFCDTPMSAWIESVAEKKSRHHVTTSSYPSISDISFITSIYLSSWSCSRVALCSFPANFALESRASLAFDSNR